MILDINGYFMPAGTPAALSFYPLTPCRVADTRNSTSSLGGPFVTGGSARSFPILSSGCNVPSTAQAYSLNLTVVPHVPLGYLSTWPTGESQPLVSTLNTSTTAVTANAAIVPAGTAGAVRSTPATTRIWSWTLTVISQRQMPVDSRFIQLRPAGYWIRGSRALSSHVRANCRQYN